MFDPTPEAESIVELSETVKELVRILQCHVNLGKLGHEFDRRLADAYRKASRAKDRVENEYHA